MSDGRLPQTVMARPTLLPHAQEQQNQTMNTEKKPTDLKNKAPRLLAVGTFVIDYHKIIRHYPNERASSSIQKEMVSTGGAPLNLLINLARLKARFTLIGAGRIGHDLDGKLITDQCEKHGIDISQIAYDTDRPTGYTDVLTVEETGKHTCFHFDGAGSHFSRSDVKLAVAGPLDFLFLGSLGALGQMDEFDDDCNSSHATRLIRDARKKGITTLIEFAPLDRGASLHKFAPTLAEADYVIVNDRTTETITGCDLYVEGQFDPASAREAAQKILDTGLRKAVIIHSGAGAVLVGADGSFYHESGCFLPMEDRVGSAGVDHAFCAGFIEGLGRDLFPKLCLEQGLAVATACRTHLTPSLGINSLDECVQRYQSLKLVNA